MGQIGEPLAGLVVVHEDVGRAGDENCLGPHAHRDRPRQRLDHAFFREDTAGRPSHIDHRICLEDGGEAGFCCGNVEVGGSFLDLVAEALAEPRRLANRLNARGVDGRAIRRC